MNCCLQKKSQGKKLLIAVKTLDISKVDRLIKAGVNIAYQNKDCETPRDIALASGFKELAEALISKENWLRTDLDLLKKHYAAQRRHLERGIVDDKLF